MRSVFSAACIIRFSFFFFLSFAGKQWCLSLFFFYFYFYLDIRFFLSALSLAGWFLRFSAFFFLVPGL